MDQRTHIEVCEEGAISDGKAKTIQYQDISILVCRSGGTLYAIRNECSHAFQCLAGGIIKNGWISCPSHGARFDLATGLPLNPPATDPVDTFPVYVINGQIMLDVSHIA